ncbi:MAG: ABC transporter permease subunit, partial [Bdellovibrionota bacterium]
PGLIELGKWKIPAIFAVCAFMFVGFILPLGGILISALSKVQGEFGLANFTLENFRRTLFDVQETGRAFSNSLILGISAATIACLLGVFLSYIQTKTKLKGRNLLDVIASVPYATPGTVVALALILAFSNGIMGVGPSLYNTLGMLALAYIVKYLSFAMKTTADGYRQIDDVLDEAARVSGAGWGKTMTTIWLPLMKAPMVAAWFLIFMPVVSELTMTILLTGPGLETIGTVIFQLQEYADASGGGASVLAIMVVVMVILINWIVKKISKGRYSL